LSTKPAKSQRATDIHLRLRPYAGVSAAERTARRRAKLIAAGLELFGNAGYRATRVKDICAQAGITDRYFYESFQNLEALLLAVFDAVGIDLLHRAATAVAAAPTDPEARVRAGVEAFVRAIVADPRKARLVFIEVVGISDAVERHTRAGILSFAQLIDEIARDYLPGDVGEAERRMGALSLVGAVHQVVIGWQRRELDVSVERLINYCVAIFLAIGRAHGMRLRAKRPPKNVLKNRRERRG
jgi:AcrR family transcriptional regulator